MTNMVWKTCVSVGALAIAGAAQAQDSATPDAVSQNDIVVTAQKREQRLVDVPMAVTAVTGEDLAEQGVQSVQDLSFLVPGLTMREDGPGSYTIFLRGLANQQGPGALVSMYLDEAPLSLSGYDQLAPTALDLARVEVLKGPQGTLYGQGSAGGTIRYVTNDPDLTKAGGSIEGEVYHVTHGNIGTRLIGVLNLPLVNDKLGLRIAAQYDQGGGWIDQPEAGIKDGNGTELLNVRAKLLWQPSDAFRAEAMVQIHRAETRLGLGYEEPDRTNEVAINPAKVLIPKNFDFTIYNLELAYDFGFAELVSATSYAKHDHAYPFAYIARPGNLNYGIRYQGNDSRYGDAEQFSQELRLSSSGGPFEWTVGGFYADGNRSLLAEYEFQYVLPAPTGTVYAGNQVYLSGGTSKTYSLFADASYKFGALTIGGGIRYFHDEQTSFATRDLAVINPRGGEFESVDPRVYAALKLDDANNLYASAAKGFRSGGFNEGTLPPYSPEKVWTYEVGAKGRLGGGVLQYELALFYSVYDDMIRRRLFVDGTGALVGELSNIGKVEVKGIEGGFAVRPANGLSFTATASYLDSVIVATSPTDPVNVVGDRTDYTPSLSFTLGFNYDFEWGADTPGFFRVDFNYRDKVTYIDRSSFEAAVLPQTSDDIALLNARIGGKVGGFDLELFGLNLTNQNKAIDPYQGWANSNRTRPRVIGIKAGYRF